MKSLLSFDDVLIEPNFSFVKSRSDVSLRQHLMQYRLDLPIISSNMDTITESAMATAMGEAGGVGALHRFCSIEDNVKMFQESKNRLPIVSLGLNKEDLERAEALYAVGCRNFVIDVAHGASMSVVHQFKKFNELFHDTSIMVGNFATAKGIEDFEYHCNGEVPNVYKVGIGGGSMCTTRIVTGCGMPTFASILDCARTGRPIVADGGIRTSGDIAKALAAGATAVMLGGMLSGTEEGSGFQKQVDFNYKKLKDMYKNADIGGLLCKAESIVRGCGVNYRGSASKDSYEAQGKLADHRAPEGESTTVPYKGSVKDILQNISAGLKSSLSYVGATNLEEFRQRATLVQITGAGMNESKAHGVK